MAIATTELSVAEQVAAVRGNVGLFDLSSRGKLRVTGSERATWLHGMVSNDVEGLAVGEGNYGTMLTDRGKMLGDYRLIVREDDLLLDTEPEMGAPLAERLDRFLISEDAAIHSVGDDWSLFGVAGPGAAAHIADRLAVDVRELEQHGSLTAATDHGAVIIACRNRTGEMGYDLWMARDAGDALWAALTADNVADVGADALEALRIEAGIARYGMDTDDDIIPLEAGLYQAIDFEKGCYVGQEIVARMHYRGHPNKLLVGFRFDGAPTVESRAELFADGDDGKAQGFVTSVAHSPTLDAAIGLGYARTQFAEVGSRLRVAAAQGSAWAEVVSTPFVPSPFPQVQAP
ncbi:glycine cleavage system protein T [Candidatus Poribacteria bacterium]|nr:glycine cleavage system protein T [Candidatus Poribacteria bacterium]